MTLRMHSLASRKYKQIPKHSYLYMSLQKSRRYFKLKSLLRCIYTIPGLLKANQLKVILLSLIIIALTLTFGNNSSILESSNKDLLPSQGNQHNNYEASGGFYGDGHFANANSDLLDLESVNHVFDELYENEILVDSQNTGMQEDIENPYANSLFKEENFKINRNVTIAEINRRKEVEINQKVEARVKELKDKWLQSDASIDNPDLKFEDTLEGFTAKSFARHGFRPKGSLVMFISDSNIDDIIKTINSVHVHFNYWAQYPWTLISVDGKEYNNTEWVGKLRDSVLFNNTMKNKTDVYLQTISAKYWEIPKWIDLGKLAQSWRRLRFEPHIESMEYRLWTRYFTGFLPLEKFMSNYDWMWYIKPGTELFCDIDYDVFRLMQDSGKFVGVAGSFKVKNLKDFDLEKHYKFLKHEHQDIIKSDNFESFLLEEPVEDNVFDKCELLLESFSISNLNFWRSKTYQKYFEIIDKKGTIFHNGWTINKVQTLAATLLMSRKSFQFFNNLGFQNDDYYNCPIEDFVYHAYRCECDQGNDMTFVDNTCSRKFYDILKIPFPDSWRKHSKYLRGLNSKI